MGTSFDDAGSRQSFGGAVMSVQGAIVNAGGLSHAAEHPTLVLIPGTVDQLSLDQWTTSSPNPGQLVHASHAVIGHQRDCDKESALPNPRFLPEDKSRQVEPKVAVRI
jgi:hypothetical protein